MIREETPKNQSSWWWLSGTDCKKNAWNLVNYFRCWSVQPAPDLQNRSSHSLGMRRQSAKIFDTPEPPRIPNFGFGLFAFSLGFLLALFQLKEHKKEKSENRQGDGGEKKLVFLENLTNSFKVGSQLLKHCWCDENVCNYTYWQEVRWWQHFIFI